jgi:hypothetical protein
MKKNFIGLMALLFCQAVMGQENTFQKEWAFGVNGGVTLSKVRFFPTFPQDILQQGAGGISVRYVSEKYFGIHAELNYSFCGWKERSDTLVNPGKYSRSLTYLELPVMTYIYFDLGKRVRLVFLAGPQIGYNLGEKELERTIIQPPNITQEEQDTKIRKYYNQKIQRPLNYGITGGMGFELRTGIGSFILDGRFYFGLSDMFRNTRSDYFQSSANQVIGIKASYLFSIHP